jgi:hypothetical protein
MRLRANVARVVVHWRVDAVHAAMHRTRVVVEGGPWSLAWQGNAPVRSGRYATGARAVLAARRLQDELRAVVAEVGGLRSHSMARQGGTLGGQSRFVRTWRGNQRMGASFLGQQESGPGRRFRCPPQIGGFSRSPAGAAFFIRAPRFKYGGSSRGSAGVALTHL